jgi:hypothetical protein
MIADVDSTQDRLTLELPTPVVGAQAPALGLVDWADGNRAGLIYGDKT